MRISNRKVVQQYHARWILGSALVGGMALILFLAARPSAVFAQATATNGLRLIKSDTQSVVVELTVPNYQLTKQTVNGIRYDALAAPGTDPSADTPGNPQLPIRNILVAVPQGANVTLRVVAQESVDLSERLLLLPIPTVRVTRSNIRVQKNTSSSIDYLANRQAYAVNDLQPKTPAQLGRISLLRSQRAVRITLAPFQYNAAQRQVRWIKRLTVEVQFAYPQGQTRHAIGQAQDEGPYERVLQSQVVNYAAAKTWRAARTPNTAKAPRVAPGTFKIALNQDGVYRLTYAALTNAGVPASVDPRTFRMFKNGAEIPILVHNQAAGIFDASVSIDFYGQGLNTIYTDTNVYWLSYGGANGMRMTTRDVTPTASPPVTMTFRDTLHREENYFYVSDRPLGNGDHWYWNVVTTFPMGNPFFIQSPSVYTFTLSDVANTGMAMFHSSVFGGAGGVGDAVPHHQQLYLNGALIADDPWTGDVNHTTDVAFPETLLISGTNYFSLTLPNDTSLGYDSVFTNWFAVDYDHLYAARNDYLAFSSDVTGSIQLTVTNFAMSTVTLFDVSDPAQVVQLTNFGLTTDGANYSFSMRDHLANPARYVAYTDAAALTPLSITYDTAASDLRNPANGADEIIITDDDFYTATAPLETWRATQRLRVMRVRISDVYDEFSDGVFDPTAIRSFLAYAYANWQAPAPSYVLLVGNGNLNYRNYQPNNLGPGFTSLSNEPQYIPPYMDAIDPKINMTATDNRYVNLTGNNWIPDMAIGRLPVRSVAETTAIINKIIAYEQTPPTGSWRTRLDFFTDNPDTAGDFYATSDSIINGYIPASPYTITRAYYMRDYTTIDAERTAVLSALNDGAVFVNYLGHGAPWQWADEALLANASAAPNPDLFSQFNNGGRIPIVLELTCNTGTFQQLGVTTLAESFIRAPGNGAVADWASTGEGVNTGHDLLAKGFYSAVFTDSVRTIGLAINSSKTALATAGLHLDLVDEFTLFGDPATIVTPIDQRYKLDLPILFR